MLRAGSQLAGLEYPSQYAPRLNAQPPKYPLEDTDSTALWHFTRGPTETLRAWKGAGRFPRASAFGVRDARRYEHVRLSQALL